MTLRRLRASLTIVAYLATIVAANWAVARFGAVPVGFGLLAPAGVYFAGLAFILRDVGQDLTGRVVIIAAIIAGAALSWFLAEPSLAIASGVAFLASELLDFAVYTPLRDRSWIFAVVASNAVGLVVDSVLFLWLAFGSLHFLAGQIVGKGLVTAIFALTYVLVRRRTRVRS